VKELAKSGRDDYINGVESGMAKSGHAALFFCPNGQWWPMRLQLVYLQAIV
jgi:hypothetical protein